MRETRRAAHRREVACRQQLSGDLNGAVVVAVALVGVVQVAVDEVVDVIAVRHRLVAAARAVHVAAVVAGGRLGVSVGVLSRHLVRVLLDLGAVLVLQVALVQVVDVVTMLDGGVAAAGAVLVGVVAVVVL